MSRKAGSRSSSVRRSQVVMDRHALYEKAVQDPETDADMMARLFRRYRKRDPVSLREDFCGTGILSVHWARSRRGRTAVGVDLDEKTLAWGIRRHLRAAGEAVASRVQLIRGNVLDGLGPNTEVACALNFSYSVFKTRELLTRYFGGARRKLSRDGVFVLDAWGGWDAQRPDVDRKQRDGFVYEWEQARFDPFTNEILCHIHFELPGGRRLERAFTYDWRLWTVPELRELLLAAGFSSVHVLWERTDDDGDGTGAFYEPRRVDNQDLWWTYIVALR